MVHAVTKSLVYILLLGMWYFYNSLYLSILYQFFT